MTKDHIDDITKIYNNFKETDISKIIDNSQLGHNKITFERPLRLSSQFNEAAVSPLRFDKDILDEMKWAYKKFGEEIYNHFSECKPHIEAYLLKNDIKLKSPAKKNLLSQEHWKKQLGILLQAKTLMDAIGTGQHDDFNDFKKRVTETIKRLNLSLDIKSLNRIINAISWSNEKAEKVIKRVDKSGEIIYEADPTLKDTENVPLHEDIQAYFEREVLRYIPDAWIDHKKTAKGYDISFPRFFYTFKKPAPMDILARSILQYEQDSEGILNLILSDNYEKI